MLAVRSFVILLLALGLSRPVAAQVPAEPPRVVEDSIYALAVDPADYPEETWIYLLDDGEVRFEADGRSVTTYRQVVQILRREAVETWGEHTFGYSSSRQRLTLNWARVVRPDGTVVSAEPVHTQESRAPVALASPIFTDRMVLRVSLGGVEPGTIVDYSYTIETFDPVAPGDFLTGWSVTTGVPTLRSRLVLDAPASVTPRILERNLDFQRVETVKDGRRVYTWQTRDVPDFEPEPFAADSNDVVARISAAAPLEWSDVARWYAGLAADRYVLTPEILDEFARVVADARTLEDSLRAAHRWIAQDFRYVSLSLGIGGYQPRLPAEVFQTRYGDCKDKATMFVALARHMGLRADPVLVSSSGGVEEELPSVQQFDHMIAVVELPDDTIYLDLTASLTPFRELPPLLQGEFGLIVRDDGRGDVVTLPKSAVEDNRTVVRIAGTLSPDGLFDGAYEQVVTGTEQYGLRSLLYDELKETDRANVLRNIANAVFDGATGEDLEVSDGRDLTVDPRIALRLRGGRAVSGSGPTRVLTLPIPSFAFGGLIAELEAREERRFPIDVAKVFGPSVSQWEFRVTLPEGWTPHLPPAVRAESDFGHYLAEYTFDGRELRVTRRVWGREGIEPPSRLPDLVQWLRDVSADDVRYIVLAAPPVT